MTKCTYNRFMKLPKGSHGHSKGLKYFDWKTGRGLRHKPNNVHKREEC